MAEETTTLDAPPEADAAATTPPEAEGPTRLKQDVAIKDVGPCKKHVTITIDRAQIDELFESKYSEILKDRSTALPGFRPGKAPKKFIVKRFKATVAEEVRRDLLMASLTQLAEDAAISPLAPPDLRADELVLPEEGPFIYEFDVEVRPDFELPPYKGMKLRKPVRTFTEADVAREQRRLLEQFGKPEPKGAGAQVELGDFVVCDLVTRDGDKELQAVNDIRAKVDRKVALNDAVIEDFAKQMVGAKVGDTRELAIQLSERVADQERSGKTINGRFTIKGIETVHLPELTKEVFASFGVTSEAGLQELIFTALERNLEYQQRQSARRQMLQQVLSKVKWDLPRDLLIRQAERTLERQVMEMQGAGMTDQQIEGRMKVLRQNVLTSTATSLMEHFILQKIGEEEKIEIGEPDIDAEVARLAGQTGESFRKLKARLEREGKLETVATEVFERRALDVVLNNAEYEEFEVRPEEDEGEVASVGAQAVPGEMVEPRAEEPAAATNE